MNVQSSMIMTLKRLIRTLNNQNYTFRNRNLTEDELKRLPYNSNINSNNIIRVVCGYDYNKKYWVDHLGNTYKTKTHMCEAYGITGSMLNNRILEGWSLKNALTVPPRDYNRKVKV